MTMICCTLTAPISVRVAAAFLAAYALCDASLAAEKVTLREPQRHDGTAPQQTKQDRQDSSAGIVGIGPEAARREGEDRLDLIGVSGAPTCGPIYRGPCCPRTGTNDGGSLLRTHRLHDRAFDWFYRAK